MPARPDRPRGRDLVQQVAELIRPLAARSGATARTVASVRAILGDAIPQPYRDLLAHDDGILVDFQEALTRGEESFVKLSSEVPVRLMYRTAFLDEGKVRFVEDIYGWDDDVAYALGYVRKPPRAKAKHGDEDVGP